MWGHTPRAHTHLMFNTNLLTSTLSADRQTRLRNAAIRRRLVRRHQQPSSNGPPTSFLSVVWPDEAHGAAGQERDHCAA
jgi:hypothetical protein